VSTAWVSVIYFSNTTAPPPQPSLFPTPVDILIQRYTKTSQSHIRQQRTFTHDHSPKPRRTNWNVAPEHACCKFTLQHLITLGNNTWVRLRSTISDLPGHLGKFNLEWHPYCFWASITFLDIGIQNNQARNINCVSYCPLSFSLYPCPFCRFNSTMRFF